jgi:hypothetical protein
MLIEDVLIVSDGNNPQVKFLKTIYQYNTQKDTINEVTSAWHSNIGIWKIQKMKTQEFSSTGKITSKRTEYYDANGIVENGIKKNFSYKNDSLDETTSWQKLATNKDYEQLQKCTFEYDKKWDKLLIKKTYSFSATGWIMCLQDIYSINDIGKYSSFEQRNYLGNYFIDVQTKSIFEYNEEGKLLS